MDMESSIYDVAARQAELRCFEFVAVRGLWVYLMHV